MADMKSWALIVACLGCFCTPGVGEARSNSEGINPPDEWEVVEQLMRTGDAAAALNKATSLVAAGRAKPRMWEYVRMVITKHLRDDPDGIEKASVEFLKALQKAYKVDSDYSTAVNISEVANVFAIRGLAMQELRSRQFGSLMNSIERRSDATAELCITLARYYLRMHDDFFRFNRRLERAETLAFMAQHPRRVRLEIAMLRARKRIDRLGHLSGASADLCKVILYDGDFGSDSNWALDQLGLVALAEGDVCRATMYLKLAGEVRVDGSLTSFGYAKDLALKLIREGYLDCAIRYLGNAYDKEKMTNCETLYGLGLAYFKKGQKEFAVKWFEEYLTLRFKPRAAVVQTMLKEIRGDEVPDNGTGKRENKGSP